MSAAQLGQGVVVIGVGQLVARGGVGQVDPHGDVDDEVLPVDALMLEDPVLAMNCQAAQLDSVSHYTPSRLRRP